jgi:4-hydroxy-tetrahydrodipicolinate synthase
MVEGYSYMYEENNPGGVKGFLFEQGVIKNEFRLPLVPSSPGPTSFMTIWATVC